MKVRWPDLVLLLAAALVSAGLPRATLAQVALAQGATDASDSVVQDLVDQVNALQDEVRHLRTRQESVLDRLPATEISLREESGLWAGDDLSVGQFESFQKSAGSKSCSGKCGGYPCQCPLQEAPCIDCPRVSTLNPYFNVSIFGALKLDMLFNEKRPISPGTPFFLLPEAVAGFDENTFDMHARQSTLGAAFTGPQFGGFQSGGLIVGMFYNDAVIVDQYGFLPLQAYGELRNEDWRFAAGLQFDVFNPGLPTVLPFSALSGSGNAGNAFRGQVRLERFLYPADDKQWTLQAALSEPIASTIDPKFRVLEDNGWPNIEGRIALGLGCVEGVGLAAQRPFELGVSGVVGELRTTTPAVTQVVADVWGVGADFRWRINERFGVAGELFTGESLGTYNGGILQNLNTVTFTGMRSSGGWIESYVYWTPCLHTHLGYGIDDPDDNDVAPGGRLKNETYFANVLWDLNPTFRIGLEFAWRETEYRVLPNEGAGIHTQFQWAF